MRRKRQTRPSTDRKARQRQRQRKRSPRVDHQPVFRSGGMGFDDLMILAGAEAMQRTGGNLNDAALAACAVYNHPLMKPAECAAWQTIIRSGLLATTTAQDQDFRQRLRACGDRLITAHPELEPEIRTTWQAFAVDRGGPLDAAPAMLPEAATLPPAGDRLPPVIDLIAVMTESWHRLRRMVEEDPDWYNRVCTHPTGQA